MATTDEEARWFVRKPCRHCPFLRNVKPFLHPARGEELAYLTENRYNEFPCHKTTVPSDDDDGDMEWGARSLTCAGFLSMQIEHGGRACPDGFTPSDGVYADPDEMAFAYAEAWGRPS